jgi:hypothetical protein
LSHGFGRHFGVRIGAVAAGKQALLAKPALPAADGEWNDDAVAYPEVRDFGAKFDHLTHVLMPENIAALHRGLVAIKQMQIGTTDGAGGDLDDGISRMLYLGIWNRIDANIAFAVPTQRPHDYLHLNLN